MGLFDKFKSVFKKEDKKAAEKVPKDKKQAHKPDKKK